MLSARRWVLLLAGSIGLPGLALAQDFAARGFTLGPTSPREASAEDLAAGKTLYEAACSQCHGDAGDGQGAMADRLRPRPRDFRRGIYKIRRTTQGELPTDQDLFRIIGNGTIFPAETAGCHARQPCHDTQQAGLARPVPPNQGNGVTRRNGKIKTGEHLPFASNTR